MHMEFQQFKMETETANAYNNNTPWGLMHVEETIQHMVWLMQSHQAEMKDKLH